MVNTHMKLYGIWTSGSKGDVVKTFPIQSSDSPFVQQTQTICAIFVEGTMRNNSVKLF